MAFGWKLLIPWGLVWILVTGAIVVLPDRYGRSAILTAGVILAVAAVVVSLVWPLFTRSTPAAEEVEAP
jgi:hypothetical protein